MYRAMYARCLKLDETFSKSLLYNSRKAWFPPTIAVCDSAIAVCDKALRWQWKLYCDRHDFSIAALTRKIECDSCYRTVRWI